MKILLILLVLIASGKAQDDITDDAAGLTAENEYDYSDINVDTNVNPVDISVNTDIYTDIVEVEVTPEISLNVDFNNTIDDTIDVSIDTAEDSQDTNTEPSDIQNENLNREDVKLRKLDLTNVIVRNFDPVGADDLACDGIIHFELLTGYIVNTSLDDVIDTKDGVLHLIECIDSCRSNQLCRSINFETGTCILYKKGSGENQEFLDVSQSPTVTIFAQKVCLPSELSQCVTPWSFEVTPGITLQEDEEFFIAERQNTNRLDCAIECLMSENFQCKAATFNKDAGTCRLTSKGRDLKPNRQFLRSDDSMDLIELACPKFPQKICKFQETKDIVMTMANSVYEGVEDEEECRIRCMSAEYECHSYSFTSGDSNLCRLSHHSRASLSHIETPYTQLNGTSMFDLHNCYSSSLTCDSEKMSIDFLFLNPFDGNMGYRDHEALCVTGFDSASPETTLTYLYNDSRCVRSDNDELFTSDVYVQANSIVKTDFDIEISFECKYQFENVTVTRGLGLEEALVRRYNEETVVSSPNATMIITNREGEEVFIAKVGDDLALRFEILDPLGPFDIFVRDLFATDGQNGSRIQLIDEDGCPTDTTILQAVTQITGKKALRSAFTAFKFPTTEMVEFQALITPCLSKCEPAQCRNQFLRDRSKPSFGRKKRSTDQTEDSFILSRIVQIKDKPHSASSKVTNQPGTTIEEISKPCITFTTVLASAIMFIISQAAIIAICFFICHKRRTSKNVKLTSANFP